MAIEIQNPKGLIRELGYKGFRIREGVGIESKVNKIHTPTSNPDFFAFLAGNSLYVFSNSKINGKLFQTFNETIEKYKK